MKSAGRGEKRIHVNELMKRNRENFSL